MKKCISIMAVLLLFGLTVWAQAGMSNQQENSGSSSINGQSSGSNMNQSSAASNTVEGCVVRYETDYYIIPEQGSAKKVTSSTTDLGQHVGHHVKATGNQTSGTASSGSTSSGSSGETAQNETFDVAEVDMVSDSCPADWNPSEMQKYQGTSGGTSK